MISSLVVKARSTAAVLSSLLLAITLSACRRSSGPEPSREKDDLSHQASSTSTARDALPDGFDTTVERVIDGDTLVVAGGRRIRLIGIDTPETKDPRRPVECFGAEASEFLTKQLAAGAAVRLVGDIEQQDNYSRTLAYVYRLADGKFVNAEILQQGYAQVLTIPPNVAHTDLFVALGREARLAGRGLWTACNQSE